MIRIGRRIQTIRVLIDHGLLVVDVTTVSGATLIIDCAIAPSGRKCKPVANRGQCCRCTRALASSDSGYRNRTADTTKWRWCSERRWAPILPVCADYRCCRSHRSLLLRIALVDCVSKAKFKNYRSSLTLTKNTSL